MSEAHRPEPHLPHPTRLAPEAEGYREIMAVHDAAVADGQAGYLDPFTGLFVMTSSFHLARGKCCHNGCRHCPYTGAEEEGEAP